MIASLFFFLFSQLGVGMMLTLLFISPRRIGNGFFKFASLTAGILMAVTLAFNYMFPSPYRGSHWPEILLLISLVLTFLYNRVVGLDKIGPALVLLIGATATGLISHNLRELHEMVNGQSGNHQIPVAEHHGQQNGAQQRGRGSRLHRRAAGDVEHARLLGHHCLPLIVSFGFMRATLH